MSSPKCTEQHRTALKIYVAAKLIADPPPDKSTNDTDTHPLSDIGGTMVVLVNLVI